MTLQFQFFSQRVSINLLQEACSQNIMQFKGRPKNAAGKFAFRIFRHDSRPFTWQKITVYQCLSVD
jgi:hypothetical protein